MAKLMWCPNCNQYVSPQKNKGNLGCVFFVLFGLGAVLLFFNFVVGVIVLAATAVFFVIGLLVEVASLATRAHCPICKATNLEPEQPRA